MGNLEFRATFRSMPTGGLVAAAIVVYFTRSDRNHPHAAE